ncbi:MAG: hypothetical protein FJZ16_07830, partial [Candidatus Omnitrophica bacterium]|nr:hypothetical protein [Candidatus Omnitrophota bacterium]
MNKIIINIALILVLVFLIIIIAMPFLAELQFSQGAELEKHNLQMAENKYLAATHLNPFDSEYFAKKADTLVNKKVFMSRERILLLKNAEKLYQAAINLNPQHADYWLL